MSGGVAFFDAFSPSSRSKSQRVLFPHRPLVTAPGATLGCFDAAPDRAYFIIEGKFIATQCLMRYRRL